MVKAKGGNMYKLITISLFLIFIAGCATVQPAQKSNLTPGMVKTTIIKGETRQNEILEVFGAPNIITQNKAEMKFGLMIKYQLTHQLPPDTVPL